MLKSEHIPIAAMIPGTQLITHSPDPDLDEVEIEKIQAQNPKTLPKDLTNPPDKIRLLLSNKRSMANIEAHRLNMVRGEITSAIKIAKTLKRYAPP
jgi:hypothetical protein